MKPFRYALDELCLLGCGLYSLNRWWIKPHIHRGFFHSHFNDLLLIPCALPVVLWLQRLLRLRAHDRAPEFGEIAFHLVVWSVLFEVVGPRVMHVTGDPLDVLAYLAGGLAAWVLWNHRPARLAPAQ